MENNNNKVLRVDDLELKQHSFILIASKRASGKTVLIRNILKYLLDKYEYDFIILFSDTAKFNGDYKFIDEKLIFKTDELEDKIGRLLKIQEKNITNDKIVNGLILLDDVKIHAKSKELINLSSMGRHFKITVVISIQYPKQLISSAIRNNLDYIFYSDLGELALRAIYESIHIPYSFKDFQRFTDDNNNNYQFIFYDGRTQNKNERLKIIKAQEYNEIKMIKDK